MFFFSLSFLPATRRSCVVLTRRLASVNTVKSVNLPMVITSCAICSVIPSIKPNIVALFTVLAFVPMGHVVTLCTMRTRQQLLSSSNNNNNSGRCSNSSNNNNRQFRAKRSRSQHS